MAAVKHAHGKNGSSWAKTSKRVVTSPLDRAKPYEIAWSEVCEVFEAARGIPEVSFVYFVGEEDDGPIKVGVAKDPIVRVRAMQTGNPRRLRVERLLIGERNIEKLLHEMWERFAIFSAASRGKVDAAPRTEWFRSEIREELFPIVETAGEHQAQAILEDERTYEAMERIVREAHGHHGMVAQKRDEIRLLASGPGYVTPRPSRI